MKITHIPNAITISRLVLVPILILFLKDKGYFGGLVLFLVAGVSDALDGFIAKRFNAVSQLGAVLDPLADKALLVSAYIMLTYTGDIPFWLMLTVVFRDVLIVGGYLIVTSFVGAVHMRPSYLSKLNTLMQIVLVVLLLAQQAAGLVFVELNQVLFVVVLVTTVISGVHYLWLWILRKEIEPINKSR